jgi:DHA1 family bicyclomycin/chloramphenicol resistance-like MFS transporter
MYKLDNRNAPFFFRLGLAIQLGAVGALAAVVLTERASLWSVVPFIVVMMSSLGLVGPAGSARYMGFFTQLAGSASSVYTTMMFSFGGVLGALTGVLYDGSLVPIVAVMLVSAIIANVIGLTLPTKAEPPAG